MKTGKLCSLLEEMNSGASDWFQTHAGLLACVCPGHRQSIREALEGFDFAGATAQLDAAISIRGVPS
jgi:hypothetical protein